jgi:PAS domain S-box-containing protein/putative nucleotidyltransferase with HDIG domain
MRNKSGKVKRSVDGQSSPQADTASEARTLSAAFRRRPANWLYASGLLAVLILGLSVGSSLLIQDQQLRTKLSDIISPVVEILAGTGLFMAARRSAASSKRRAIGWGSIALAMILYALGDITWLILEIGLKVQPFPSVADGFYLAYYPVSLAGVLLLLDRPASGSERAKRGLDITIIMGAAILGCWNFLIGPIITSNSGGPILIEGILLAYPIGDLVLFGALLLLIYNRTDRREKAPLYLLGGSLLATIIADTIYSRQSLQGMYVSGGILDNVWVAGTLLMGLAGIYQWAAMQSTSAGGKNSPGHAPEVTPKSYTSYLPYLWVAIAYILLVAGGLSPLPMGFPSLAMGVGAIIALILVRQIIAFSENRKLNLELQATMARFQSQSAELEETNQEFRLDIAERKQVEEARTQSEALFRALFELSPDSIVLIDPHDPKVSWPIIDCNKAACLISGYQRDELIGQTIDILNAAPQEEVEREAYRKSLREEGRLTFEVLHRHKDGSTFPVEVATAIFTVNGRELVLGIDRDITARKQAEEEISHRLAELEAVNQISTALRSAETREEMLPLLLDSTLDILHATRGAIWLYDPVKEVLRATVMRGWDEEGHTPLAPTEKPGEGINGRAFTTREPFFARDFHLDLRLPEAVRREIPPGMGGAANPIRAGQKMIGTFEVDVTLPRELTSGEVHLLSTLSEIAGNAIQRTSLHRQTERRLQQLAALSNIDRAISSTFDLRLSLGLLLKHVAEQLGVDATDVLLFNSASHSLEFSAGRGFRTQSFERAHLQLGEGYAGQAALRRETVHVSNMAAHHDNPRLEKYLGVEQFVSYYGVPLIAKGEIRGVLEIFQRSPLEPDQDWLDFLSTLAGQAAIAIDSVMQFENIQRSNSELSQAYDETIEGWSRALDLRDRETEGHTLRVTEMTVALAREAGLGEAELVQVRWGALLHDIGKMGVPDAILFKPGALTDEEWVTMKKHPVFAFEMLSPIRYLHGALDIPYCHHEKWDGSGYPRGLIGEQIPLIARIFAVVDVWDALSSDRPYRKAWTEKKVRSHIQSGAGTHFDPQLAKAFLESKVVSSRKRP